MIVKLIQILYHHDKINFQISFNFLLVLVLKGSEAQSLLLVNGTFFAKYDIYTFFEIEILHIFVSIFVNFLSKFLVICPNDSFFDFNIWFLWLVISNHKVKNPIIVDLEILSSKLIVSSFFLSFFNQDLAFD